MCVLRGEGGGAINLDSRKMRERAKPIGKKDMDIARRAFLFLIMSV